MKMKKKFLTAAAFATIAAVPTVARADVVTYFGSDGAGANVNLVFNVTGTTVVVEP